MSIDLDKARAARLEAEGGTHHVLWGGEDFELPPELPFQMLAAVTGLTDESPYTAITGVLRELMGEEPFERFMGHEPSINDMRELIDGMTREYGLGEDVGEVPASPPVS